MLALIVGCASKPPAQKSLVVLLPDSDGHVGVVEVTTDAGTQVLDRAGQSTTVTRRDIAPTPPKEMTQAQIEATFGEAIRAKPLMPESFMLYFESGAATLTSESRRKVQELMTAISKREQPNISVVGHTDAVGSEQSNLKLSLERAQAVRKQLEQLGVDPKTLEVSSHGEKNPLIPTSDATAEPRNRRVEVTVR